MVRLHGISYASMTAPTQQLDSHFSNESTIALFNLVWDKNRKKITDDVLRNVPDFKKHFKPKDKKKLKEVSVSINLYEYKGDKYVQVNSSVTLRNGSELHADGSLKKLNPDGTICESCDVPSPSDGKDYETRGGMHFELNINTKKEKEVVYAVVKKEN